MRILRSIVGTQSLLVQSREANFAKRRPVGSEFVGDDSLGNEALTSKQFPQQPQRRGLVALGLDQDFENLAFAVGMAAQKATRVRRQLAAAVDADHAALRERQEELERLLLTAPATSWVEAVAKARYLLILFAQSPAAEDLTRARLIADVFADFERLLAEPKRSPVAGYAWLAPASLIQRRIAMAKGQQRGNREAKKPKKEKPKVAATAQASFGLTPPEIDGCDGRSGQEEPTSTR